MTPFDLTPDAARVALSGVVAPDLDGESVLDACARAVWSFVTEPGDGVAGSLIDTHGATDALRRVLTDAPRHQRVAGEYGIALRRWAPRLDAPAFETALRVAERRGVRLVTRADPMWPAQLDDLGVHVPIALWARGRLDVLSRLQPSVALVGARAATSYGDHVARELAADLAGGGIPIISGAAYGIDGSAHQAALSVGGTTVAVLAGGVERAYPAGHTEMIERIAREGVIVGEQPCGSTPTKWRFLQRNRIIAALSEATVVVEAGWRSGSLNTAGHAASLSRALGAVPGPVTSAASAGCHRLLREYGAQCITSAADVRELVGIGGGPATLFDDDPGRAPTDDAMRVRDALSTRAWRPVADLARRSGMSADSVESHLGLLLLQGEAARDTRGWRLVTSRRG
ncbi:DNA-processing protein DprA [Planococcus sp. APC 4015]|nr:DNA-processing protein DprA [Planococcus sp. APC 4015]